jgi:drug/metabolite transporter (DMT)-like permease
MQIPKYSSLLKLALMICPFFLWGTAMVAMKGAALHTTPFFLAAFRLLPAGLLILGAAGVWRLPQPPSGRAWAWIILFGLVDGTLFQGFLTHGLMRTDAGLGSVMIDSQPLAVAALSAWLLRESIGLWGGIGLGLGVVGISCIGLPAEWWEQILDPTNHDPLQTTQLFAHGEWLMLLAALSMAVGTILIRYVTQESNAVVATGWHMIIGAIPLVGATLLWEESPWQQLTALDWSALTYSTVFGSAIAYGIFFYFAAQDNLTSLSSLTFLTPIFALSFGSIFLQESLTSIQFGGVAVTLISVLLINQREAIGAKLQPSHPELMTAEPPPAAEPTQSSNLL